MRHARQSDVEPPPGIETKVLQIAANEFIPVIFVYLADRCRVKTGGIVNETIQTPTPIENGSDQLGQAGNI